MYMLKWPTREHTPFEKELFNRHGFGKIQMGRYKYDNSSMVAAFSLVIIKEICEYQKKTKRRLKIMPNQKVQKDGIKSSPTLTFDGSNTDWQAADGLDATITLPGDELIARGAIVASLSAATGIMSMAFEIDGTVETRSIFSITNISTTAVQRNIESFMHIGDGAHRIRLMVTNSTAITVTLTAQQRRMVLLALGE